MTTQTLPLNLIPKGVCPRLYVSQYDKGQEWNFDIYAGTEAYTIPSGSTVTIQGTKPDKTGFQYACSFSGNRVTATEQQQMTIIAGDVPAEIRIEKNNEIIATLNFIIAVEKAALADDTVISETDLPLIEEAIEVLGHADELVQRIEGDVTTSGNNALKAEGFAVGQQNGSDVASGSPYYHNSAKYYKEQAANSASTASNKASDASGSASAASGSASSASTNALKAEGFAVGQQNGSDVASGSPYYHNSAKYYKEQAADSASTASTKAGEAAASAQAAAQSAAHLTIDDAMSTTSENALQNKVITSTIQNLSTVISKNGAKNILPFDLAKVKAANTSFGTWSGNAYTHNGVTFTPTFDSKGNLLYIDVNGKATPYQALFYISSVTTGDSISLPSGNYIANGCPVGGANGTYKLDYAYQRSGAITYNTDYGNGVELALENDDKLHCYITIANNYTASHLKFYPMIRLASDTDPTYEPYAMTNQQLTTETTGLIDNQKVNGAKNRLNLNLSTIKAINNSGSWSGNVYTYRGITFTLTVDGNNNITKIVVNGTASAHAAFFLASRQGSDNSDLIAMLKANSYVPSLGVEISTNIGIKMDFYSSLSSYLSTWNSPDNKSAVTIPSNATIADVYFNVISGNTANNVSVYPMISLENFYKVDPTFVPYAKSNRELTEDVTDLTTPKTITVTQGALQPPLNVISVVQIGKLVHVSIRGNIPATTADYGRLWEDLPPYSSKYANNIQFYCFNTNDFSKPFLMAINNSNGKGLVAKGSSNASEQAWYAGEVMYITD